jgi:hypothetical protein
VPYEACNLPSRFATTQSLTRDSGLQQYASRYQSSAVRDFANLNSCNPYKRPGETLLYLPVNFVSHFRGAGLHGDDEELLKTESGTKLYLSNSPKKLDPEKLNQGLFLGANAIILARLIPNLTPDIAIYLDYLRQLGDLLVNYTSSSVYLLDHVHLFEEVVLGRPWNEINSTLSLNTLKKKESSVSVNSSKNASTSSSSDKSGTGKQSGRSEAQGYGVLPICWQYNQPGGCRFEPNCRYTHKCNMDGCTALHPAYKHTFQTSQACSSKSA